MLTDGTADTAPAQVRGMNFQAAAIGEGVTLYHDVNVRYGSGMTPGAKIFASGNAGLISDTATVGGKAPIGYVVDATRIRLWESRY